MISFGLLIHALLLALIPSTSSWVIAGMILIILWVFIMFGTVPAIQTFFVHQAPQSSNLVLSLNTAIMHLGVAIGTGIGGIAVESTGTIFYNPWIASGIGTLSFIIAMVSFFILRRNSISSGS